MDTLDQFAKDLQRRIDSETEQSYSPRIIEHWKNPRNWGIMHDADGYGRFTGPCGDTMEISIKVQDGCIVRCTFDTDGCGTTIACGSILTEIVHGMTIEEAEAIDAPYMLHQCGTLPAENEHCALLAATTLQDALRDYMAKHR